MRLRRFRAKPAPFWVVDGAPVWMASSTGARFAGVVDGRPWFATGRAEWLVNLRDVETAVGPGRFAGVAVADLSRRDAPAPGGGS